MPKQRPPFRVLVFISILAVGLITVDRPATAGTGGGMQIPNLPTGKFNPTRCTWLVPVHFGHPISPLELLIHGRRMPIELRHGELFFHP